MGKIYSVEALISIDGKNYKGMLDFYDSKCMLYSPSKIIEDFSYDIGTAEFLYGTTKVSFLGLYTKEKCYIQIKSNDSYSPLFVVNDDKVQELKEVLAGYQINYRNRYSNYYNGETSDDNASGVTEYVECAVSPIINNPYRILGISAYSTPSQANDALEKIKRLDRLDAMESYKTAFNLAGYPSCERNLAVCQNAIASIKDIQNKWFWFDSAEACSKWQFQSYRSAIKAISADSFSYDVFLAQYLYVLSFDSELEHRNEWYRVFDCIQLILEKNNAELLRSKFTAVESSELSDDELLSNFREYIFSPIIELIEHSEVKPILNLFRTIRMDKYPVMRQFKKNVGGIIAQWVILQEKNTWSEFEDFIGKGALSNAQTSIVWQAGLKYEKAVQLYYDDIIAALTMEPIRKEMVEDSYRKVMDKLVDLLLAGGEKAKAARFGAYLYRVADEEKRKEIIKNCGDKNKSNDWLD